VVRLGKAYTFGEGTAGELGDGIDDDGHEVALPTLFLFDMEPIATITCGNLCSAIITTTGKLFLVGLLYGENGNNNEYKHRKPHQVQHDEPFKQVSFGDEHIGCITQSNKLYLFGNGSDGVLGDGSVEDHVSDNVHEYWNNIKVVTCTGRSTLFLDVSGRVYVCGHSQFGKLGDGIEKTHTIPRPIGLLDQNIPIDTILSNRMGWESAFISRDGNVYMCGKKVRDLFYFQNRIKKMLFNGGVPVSCGAVTGNFSVFIINKIETLLPIASPCINCNAAEAQFYVSDYSGAYCGEQCFKKRFPN